VETGDRTPPCLTPQTTANLSPCTEFHGTAELSRLYQCIYTLTNTIETHLINILWKRPLCKDFIESIWGIQTSTLYSVA